MMNKKITLKNRILSMLLTVIMVFSMVPMSVFAAEDSYVAEVTIGNTTTPYSDLASAFSAVQYASGSATVKLLSNVDNFYTGFNRSDGVQLSNSVDVTLDLNGHYIERYNNAAGTNANKKAVFYVTSSAKLTVMDSVGGGEIMQPLSEPALIVDSGASLTVLSGTITNTGAGYGIRIDGGTLTVEGGTIKSVFDTGICVGGGTVTVTGDAKIHSEKYNALLITGESSVTLSGGTYTTNGKDKSSILTNVGKVTDLLADGFRYADANGLDVAITEDGQGTDSDYVTVSDFGIKYIDADGAEQKCTSFTELTETTDVSKALSGWYAVTGTVSIAGNLGVTADNTLNLILCDGAELNLQYTLYLMGGATLNIYGQSGGTGKLTAKSRNHNPGIGLVYNTNAYNGTVNIYGGTVIAQSVGGEGAQAIGINPSIMTGKVNVNIAKGLKCVKTDDLNTACAYDNTDGTSVTITKCTDHKWSYANITDDTHDQTCDLCGTTETGVKHTTASYKNIRIDPQRHYLICTCGKEYGTQYHTYTYAPNSDGLTHTATCICELAVDDIAHTYKGEDEICICGAVHSATYDGKKYASLQSAIDAAAAVGGTVTIAQQVNENVVVTDGTVTIDLGGNRWSADISYSKKGYVPLTVNGGSVTLKNGNLFQGSSTSTYETAIVINGGSVTVEEDAHVRGGTLDRDVQCPSITLNGGNLMLKEGATLLSGLQVPENKVLADYLPEGTAFVKCSYDNSSNTVTVPDPQEFVPDVYTTNKLTERMVIVSHTHDFGGGTACPCGFNCDHSVVDSATGKCENCGTQIYTATVTTADGSCAHFDNFADAWNAAIENEGSTLKLLSDITLNKAENGIIAQSGKFTFDLNGKTVSGEITYQLLTVSGTADITVRNGKLINTFSVDRTDINNAYANVLKIDGGAVTLDQVELIAGQIYQGARSYAAYIFSGSLTVVSGTFTGMLVVRRDTSETPPSVKITSATLHNGILYDRTGITELDYAGLKAFFADSCMLFDENGKYIDLTSDAYWSVGTSSTTFKYADKAIVKSHEHTYVDGKCSECDYACPHDSGINDREASYFEKAICSICHAEYGEVLPDTTAPTGKITIQERTWWESLLNSVSFGLFYKEDVKAEITATDDSYSQSGYDETKHAVKIEYLISDTAMSKEAVEASTFTKYDGTIDLSNEQQYVIYAKLTDHAGNVNYISTDGFEIDKTAPLIEDMENYGVYYFCGGKTITVIEKNIDKVTMDGAEISLDENGQFTLPVDSEKHKIIVADKAGNETTVWITVYPSHDFDPETDTCLNCGTHAVAKVENGEISDRFATGDELFAALEDEKYDGVTVTLLKDVVYTERFSLKHDLTIEMNGKSLRASDRVAFAITSGEVTIRSSDGSANLSTMIGVNAGAHLVMGEGIGEVETIVVVGKLTVYSGSYGHVYTMIPNTKSDDITLYGGTYGRLELKTLVARDILAKGYRYRDLLYADAGDKTLKNVTVIPCDHANVSNNSCAGCGMEIFLSAEKNGETTLFGTFEDAIRYAEQNEGCTVKLLRDLILDDATVGSLKQGYRIYLEKGRYTLDLAGKTLDIINGNEVFVCEDCDLTIGDSAGGGKVISSSGGAVCVGYYLNNKAKLTVTGGEFTVNVTSYNKTALVLKGGSFKKYVISSKWAKCSPFVYLFDRYTFALIDPASGNNYANEGNAEVDHDGSQMIRNVTVVPAPVYILAGIQPQDKTFYLTSPDANKRMSAWVVCRDLDTDKKITLTLEKTDGTAIMSSERDYAKNGIISEALDLKALAEGSELYRVKIEFDGYICYSNTFTIIVAVCDHPGYDEDNKCTQCECDLVAAIVKDGKTTGYTTIAEALTAAQTEDNEDCTLSLLADTNEEITAENGSFTLDAGGHSVNGNITVKGNSKLKLENGFFNGSVTAESGELRIDGGIYKNNMLVKSGAKLFIFSGSCSGTVTAESGSSLTVTNGGLVNIVAKSGSTLAISNGSHTNVTIEENVNTVLSGGYFDKISVEGKNLIDCLDENRAFVDNADGKIIDGRSNEATSVHITVHTHSSAWNTDTHEKLCGCGYVEETDTEAPVISSIKDGGVYYNLVYFSVTDANDFTVTVDGTPVQIPLTGYLLLGDNRTHTITATDVAGNTVTVTVTVYKLYFVTLSRDTVGYTVKGVSAVGYGMDYEFTVKIADGYSKTENYRVLVNGTAIDAVKGDETEDTFLINDVSEDLVITVEGVADITAPEVEINIHGNSFKEFLNSITFGLFFKETQTVTVIASDAGSGISKVEYLLSETAFTDKDTITGDWTELAFEDGKASFDIEPNKKAYVYVRVTDESGNVQVINSEGVVVYTDSEAVTEDVNFTMLDKADVTFDVKLNGNTIKALYNGDELIDNKAYTVSADGTVTLKNSYLSTLAAGEYTISVKYNPMGEEYKTGDEPAMTSVKLTVEKKTPVHDHMSSDGKIYDGKSIGMPTFNTDSDGALTFEYKPADADDTAYTTTAPKNVGKYTIRITTAETDTFKAASSTMEFEIQPREVTISGVTVEASKIYDGTTDAKITNAGKPSDNYDGENLTIVSGKAAYDDKNVGTGKTVTFTDFALAGDAAGNYKLVSQPTSVKADIAAKEITINDVTVENSKIYDGTTVAKITNAGTPSDNYDGENLTIVAGKAAYDNKNVGTDKTVSFTDFALVGDAAGNYKLVSQPTSGKADITVKEITINGVTVEASKIYDGTTDAKITNAGKPSANYDGENLTIVAGKAAYDDKNVGTDKTVTFADFALAGDAAGNYKLVSQPSSVKADIAVKEITINGATAEASKIYDGTTVAKITNAGTLSANYDGDNLTIVSGKAAYDDKNVGTGKTVTFTGFALAGDAAGNYKLAAQPTSVKADITAKELTVDNLKIKDKQYDSTNTAEFDGTPVLVGVVDGDDLKLINGIPTFDSTNVAENIPVSFTKFTLSGDDVTVGNYKLIQPDSTTANIVEYIADGSEYSVNSNDWINTDFVITAKDGYKLSLTNTADGEWSDTLTALDETENGSMTFYVKNTATGAISTDVTENYKIDKTAPTGEIKLNEYTSSQNDFDEIGFSLFFNDDVNVKLTADDNASGIKSVMYYMSDKLLTDSEVKAITDWTDNSDFNIEANDMDQFIIYVRIEDNAGNIAYIGSDGAIFDTTAPEVIGVENGKTYYVTKRVAIDDENLESLTLNDEAVDGVFTLDGDTDATYVIKATDKAGNVTEYTVTMKPISTITDAISNITVDNVKSSDSDTVSAVERQILDIAEMFDEDESTEEEWNKLIEASAKCKELEKRIEEIANETTRLTDGVNGFDIDKVINTDKADIEKLVQDIDTLLDGDNLTDSERSSLESLKATAQALLDRIKVTAASENDKNTDTKDTTTNNVKSENNKDNTPHTGDNGVNLALWFTLLFIGSGATICTTVVRKKKKRFMR